MSPSRVRVAAIWTISAWPALNFVMLNLREIALRDLRSCLWIALLTLALGSAGQALHWFANRRGRGGVVVVAWLALVLLLFGYSLVGDALDAINEHFGLLIPAMPAWSCLCVLCAILVFLSRGREKVHVAAGTFCIVVGAATTILFGRALLSFEPPPPVAAIDPTPVAAKPARLPGLNVYYVILDSYAGRRSLAAQTGFDNGEFLSRMAQRGFTEASTERSNYLQTAQTLAGIFALDYPFSDDPRSWRDTGSLYPDLFARPTPPALLRRAAEDGYVTWYSPTFWFGCGHRHLKCIGQRSVFEPDYLTRSFLAPTPFGHSLTVAAMGVYDALTMFRLELPALLATGKPFFVFAHHMSPHPPFAIDAQCRPRSVSSVNRKGWVEAERAAYAGAVKCVNREVETLVDAILHVNPQALIVLQGDHGSAFSVQWDRPMAAWSADSIAERSSYLNLIRAPGDCKRWLDRPLGQVNTARFVLACLEGKAPSYLPERTYLSTYSPGKEWGEFRRLPD